MATDIIARGMAAEAEKTANKYKAGTNIIFTENADGTVAIEASGEVSSEDTVARNLINNHKENTNNPHGVTAEQIGLGNVDNTSDLEKPISNAMQTALDKKVDSNNLGTAAYKDIPTDGNASDSQVVLGNDSRLSDSRKADGGNADTLETHPASDFVMSSDFEAHAGNAEIHVTAEEKVAWNSKAEMSDIPETLPANGGNADTAKTLSSWAGNAVLNLNDAPLGFSRAPGNAENNPFDFWVTSLLLGGYSDKYKQQYVFPWGNSNSKQMPKYRVYDNGEWKEWQSCQTSITNKSTAQSLINCLDIADGVPHDEDYFIVQYAGGGTERTDFYRKPTSKLYDYIRNKLMSSCSFRGKDTGFIYAFLNGSSGVSLNDIKYESHRFAFNVTDYPSEAGISYGFLDVDYFDGIGFAPVQNGIVRQTWTKYNDPSKTWTRLYISSSETEGTWTDWVRTSNDSNADTVDGKHASDFVLKTDYDALAARVAALEEAIIVSNGETTE